MGCCGSTPKIDNINEEVALQNDKLDKLVDKVVQTPNFIEGLLVWAGRIHAAARTRD